jgi:hypothetical protein
MAELSAHPAIAISPKFIADRGDGGDDLFVVSFHWWRGFGLRRFADPLLQFDERHLAAVQWQDLIVS